MMTTTQQKRLTNYSKLICKKQEKRAQDTYKRVKELKTIEEKIAFCKNWDIKIDLRKFKAIKTKADQTRFIKESIFKHYTKKVFKIVNELEIILSDTTPDFKSLEIRTNWVKSHTWGYNPNSRGWINNSNYQEARASGCGYDKLSACYNQYLNHAIIKKAILLEALKHPLKTWKRRDYNKNYILPYCVYIDEFGVHIGANGAGVGTVRDILEFIGAKVITISDDAFDYLEAN